ncbi:GNAT family N-acetyltransferase [Pontibacter sp. HSC-14F20]|uniref:GNAT family N-acetyltransferase n=1 Tax=Pontibacter sp. HSC-14F20 TaxID=2864136 RepID=UPI001C72E750|nr:GNAT family N-acetyltransferase [Pontibacter sp. HSC-14F20]MBX0332367.1 GNAT family N-acetyltransferase [Pontibacter sp. HSC-14F20]
MNTLLQKNKKQQIDVIELLTGKEALAVLADQNFQQQWDKLYTSCSWATVFQSRDFVYTWYQSYYATYLPILAIANHGDKLTGLLALAQGSNGQLVGAGDNQAEYQVWLTDKENSTNFIKQALTVLLKQFPQSEISIKFVPANTPLQWLETDLEWQRNCFRRTVMQPLLSLDKENLSQELRKKNRREKLNRLKRQGNLSFIRITDTDEFCSVLNELTIQSDFRKGAMYNKRAFEEDSCRKAFLYELFKLGLLHVTLLKVEDTIVASNVGVTGRNWVHLQGINTHSPMQAKHSPGILHFLMLGVMLAEEGIAVFDLTPGSDPYKESLATDFTHSTELVFGNMVNILNKNLKFNSIKYLKNTLPKLGIAQHQIRHMSHRAAVVKEKVKLLNRRNLFQLLKKNIQNIVKTNEVRVFCVQPAKGQHQGIPAKKNELKDLLCYIPTTTLVSKWEFLSDAMRRLETGQHVYTWQENGQLLGCAWLSESNVTRPSLNSKLELSAQAAVLSNFYCPSLSQVQLQAFIQAITTNLSTAEDRPIYAISAVANKPLYKALEALYPSLSSSSK